MHLSRFINLALFYTYTKSVYTLGALSAGACAGGEFVLGDGLLACCDRVSTKLRHNVTDNRQTYCTEAQAAFRKSK